ncbi:YbfB/YjiJ family MFS transporter [Nocardia sp. NPDC052254]|uniref:YbfB/YjiJ family MFS transporter n=1 Tax=Nocardia sp. NPDC052254 TaxID=3155681 RepID=UPI00341C3828
MIIAPARHTSWAPALRASSGLAAAMGIGRFAFTPLLPVMIDAGRLSAHTGAIVAAANYAGYLLGAVAAARFPHHQGRTAFRVAGAALILSEAGMAVPAPTPLPVALRLIAGIASAVLFIGCAQIAARHENRRRAAGIAFAGVGTGIAATGALILIAQSVLSWQALWLASAALTALLVIPALSLDIRGGARTGSATVRSRRNWRLLQLTYFAEGLGYIVLGTFLVAAVDATGHRTAGTAIWIVVGLAAAPATVLWGATARRIGPSVALVCALILQCASALLPTLWPGVWPAVVSAALFGATFMGITLLALEIGDDLAGPGAAATLTAGYGLGQMLGPLVVAPVLGDSYDAAFTIAAVVLVVAAGAALAIVPWRRHRAGGPAAAEPPVPVRRT